MQHSTVEVDNSYKGFDYLVVLHSNGIRCGYVRIPEGHPFFRKTNYYEIDVDVHGGLTFGQEYGNMFSSKAYYFSPGFWIGFDCGHYNDARDFSGMDMGNLRILQILQTPRMGEDRSKHYVENECKCIIDQCF